MDISADTIALATLIIGLAGLIIALFAWLRVDIKSQDQRLDDVVSRLGHIEGQVGILVQLLQPRGLTPPEQPEHPPRTGTDG